MTTLSENGQDINGRNTADLLKIVSTSALRAEMKRREGVEREKRKQRNAIEGKKLRELRESLGMDQSGFAKILGVSQSSICWAETGKRPGALALIRRFETAAKFQGNKAV